MEIEVVLPWRPDKCASCQVFGHDCEAKTIVLEGSTEEVIETAKEIEEKMESVKETKKGPYSRKCFTKAFRTKKA